MVDYAAEIEVRLDSEAECEEIMKYDEVQDYLANGTYHEGVTKAVKGVIRKRAKEVPTHGWCPSLQGGSETEDWTAVT